MKRIVGVFSVWLVLALSAHAASFDCAKARTKVEHLICGNAELSKLDEKLNTAYKTVLQEKRYARSIKKAQIHWMKKRNKCADAECVKHEYESRLYELTMKVEQDNASVQAKNTDAGEVSLDGLSLIYSRDQAVCERATKLLPSDKVCRYADATKCSDKEQLSVFIDGKPIQVIEEIAVNEYGYTEVAKSTLPSLENTEIIYVQNFQGDHNSRLVETWKVNTESLNKLLALTPGPVPYKIWVTGVPAYPKGIHSKELAALLKAGEKISDEWSPLVRIFGNTYAIKRECSGLWVFGGYYACNKVIKLTLIRLDDKKRSLPYCQFGKRKKQ